jgi:all-trans-8'-apo-beta-carotenal 15,15'-oxygenase
MLFNGQMGSRAPATQEGRWRDPSHTNVYAWGDKLLACHEYTLPHHLDPHTLRTIGPTDLGGTLKRPKALCAHFRYDQKQDHLVTVGFKPGRPAMGGPAQPPELHICEYDRTWTLAKDVHCNIPGLNYVHDVAVSPSFYVVQQTPFVEVSLEAVALIMNGEKMPGEQMQYYEHLPCRLVFIPRGGGDPIMIDLPKPVHVYHFGNVREDAKGHIDVDLVGLGKDFNMEFQHGLWLSNGEEEPGILYTVRVDISSRKCLAMQQLDSCSCEFPAVHPGMHVCGPSDPIPRFTYLMANDHGKRVPFTHVVKVDRFHKDRQSFEAKGAVGEPCFIPRKHQTSQDDGYVIVQVFDTDTKTTSFQILDAKDLASGPVCTLDLQRFLPTGFHGTWCNEPYGEVQSRL